MTEKRYHDGRLIILENETYITNEHGVTVRRVETILEDGTQLIQEIPMNSPEASAPSEEELDIPFAHATSVPESSPTVPAPYVAGSSGGPVAVITGPPQPPRVAVITGPPRPPAPPQVSYPSSRYIYRDERTGACMICGLSALVCLVICCCCFLPAIIFPIAWAASWSQVSTDDDIWNDDHF